jgi:serine/threonine protein kinase/Tfp pilus assembly protein PilF
MDDCLSNEQFERQARGELAPAELDRFQTHLAECDRCLAAFQAFKQDNAFLNEVKHAVESDTRDDASTRARPHPPAETRPTMTQEAFETDAISPAHTPPEERFPEITGYEVRRIVGRGGMGVVYEAIQEKLNRPVALKVLPAVMGAAHPELVTRFQREAATAAQLHHTNIIPIYDFGESPDGYYYAMELISGRSLNVVIKRLAELPPGSAYPSSVAAMLARPDVSAGGVELPSTGWSDASGSGVVTGSSYGSSRSRGHFRLVAQWMADAADALHYAHLRGLVHRDIKPGNLMLCTDGRIMVLDFGLVKGATDHSVTATGSLVGTYRYMSPEQVGAKRINVDARTDVYSLGATLYELLTLQPAFPSTEQSELLSQIMFRDPTPPRRVNPAIPADLQTICLKALEKRPADRYQTARAMAEDLSSYLHDRTIVARPQGPVRWLFKFARRRKLEVIGSAAVLLAALALSWGAYEYRAKRLVERTQRMKDAFNVWQHERDLAEAEKRFLEILEDSPRYYGALVSLASVLHERYYAEGEALLLVRADELLEQALAVDSERNEAWNVRGVVHQASGRLEEAEQAYQRALECEADYYPTYVNLAILHAIQGNLEKAEEFARQSVEHARGKQVMPCRIHGAILQQLYRPEAMSALEEALALSNRADVPSLVLVARHHLREGRYKQARDLAITADMLMSPDQQLQGRSQNLRRVKRTLALAWLRLEEWDEAIAAAQVALDAKDEPAFGYLILAIAHARLGETDAAQTQFQNAVTAWPPQLETAPFVVSEDGSTLWFDTAAELNALEQEAGETLEAVTGGR